MPSEIITYTHQDAALEAYVAYPEGPGPFPTILIAHPWDGRNKFVCDKADALAKLGYIGFALDMFGQAKVGTSTEENGKLIHHETEKSSRLKQPEIQNMSVCVS